MEIHKTTIESSEKLLHALSITHILKDDYTEIPGLFHNSPIGTLTIVDALNYNYLLISNMQGSTPFKQQSNKVFDVNSSTIRKSMPATIETPRIVSKESKVL